VSDVHADAELDADELDADELDDDELDDDDEIVEEVSGNVADAVADDADEDDAEEDDDDVDDDDEDDDANLGGLSADVLEYLARSIVDDADAVDIEVEEGRRSVMLRLHVSPADMGRVIGRRGRVAQAIRTVVRAAGAREGVDTSVDIVD
jgi:predicted RNA-binding protein YlqC (UPF0109 family)